MSNAQEKVSNALLKEVNVTDIFINNIRIVYEYCNTGTPFGQAHVIEKVTGLGAGKYKFVDNYDYIWQGIGTILQAIRKIKALSTTVF